MTEEKKLREEMPESAAELEPKPETGPEPAAESEPAAAAEPSHEGKRVSDLALGDIFPLEGKRYRLEKVLDETVTVVLLKTRKQEVAPKKFINIDIGIERLEMPGDTIIE